MDFKEEVNFLEDESEDSILNITTGKEMKRKKFSSEEKKKLASLIKSNVAIWNPQHRLHKNSNALASCWKKVSTEMNKPVMDCKAMWRSLRDSMRYHASSKRSHSNEERILPDDEESCWEFSESMSFLTSITSQQRRRTVGTTKPEVESHSNKPSTSNYAYKQNDTLLETASALGSNISNLVEMQSRRLAAPSLKYQTMLANWDRMLQKLPEDIVEDLHFKITSEIYEEIKKQNQNSVNSFNNH